MGALLGGLCLFCPVIESDVKLSDLKRWSCGGSTESQIRRCEHWRHHLERSEQLHGWQGGVWHERMRAIEEARLFWHLHGKASDSRRSASYRLARLSALRKLIGPERYALGWVPPLLPVWVEEQPAKIEEVPLNPVPDGF